mgnify:CR=1 FL=1
MLRPDEFRVGDLANESSSGITLLLPRAPYEHVALMGEAFDQRYGIVLDGDLPGQAYPVSDDEAWRGILVPRVIIEVDEKSAFDPSAALEAGALIREGTVLALVAVSGPYPHIARPLKITLNKELPQCEERESVGFRAWRIVIGEGQDKRELFSAQVHEFAKTRAATLAASRS